ncbi:TPA: eae-like domain protein [Enterobacter roggenkampii]
MKNNTQPALKERIEKALEDFTKGRASMHVPPLDTDVDVVLAECSDRLSELEARCAALAAENAGLKAVCEDRRAFIMNGVQLGYIQVPTVETDPALETIRVAVSPQEPTPATDAFLAEVRAAAVDEVCLKISNAIVNCYQDEQVGLDAAATICGDFAAQLRKGVPS